MLENMTTGEKALIGATAIGIAALVFHKPTRNAVGLSDNVRSNKSYLTNYLKLTNKINHFNLTEPSYNVEKKVNGQWKILERNYRLEWAEKKKKEYEENNPANILKNNEYRVVLGNKKKIDAQEKKYGKYL